MGSLLVPSLPALIQELKLLLEESPIILASPEDADFFRMHAKKKIANVPPPILSKPKNLNQEALAPLSVKIEQNNLSSITQTPPSLPENTATPMIDAVILSSKNRAPFAAQAETPTPKPIAKVEMPPSKSIMPVQTQTLPSRGVGGIDKGMLSLVKKTMPNLAILEEIPSDLAAKRIANRWQTKNQCAPISVLLGAELPEYKIFLQDLAIALDLHFGPAKIVEAEKIEQERQWASFLSTEELKLIIICDATLWQLHHLRQLYKENPAQESRTLGNIPLFLLPDLSLYFKDPLLKKSLWKALCQKNQQIGKNVASG